MNPIAMALVLVTTLSFFSYSVFRRYRQMKVGTPDPRFSWKPAEIADRVKTTLIYALGQKKMQPPGYSIAGLAHMLIFFGFQVLLLNSIHLWGRGFDADWNFFFNSLSTEHIIGQGYSAFKEIFVVLVIVGVAGFAYLRAKGGHDSGDASEVGGKARMTVGFEPWLILGIIGTMMLADLIYVGARGVLEARAMGAEPTFLWYEPFGSPLSLAFNGLGDGALKVIEHAGFWWHAAWVLLFLNILPYSKHFHILTVIPNVFAYERRPEALPKIDDMEGRIERDESLGIKTVEDLTYKGIMDLYTCTECGRCSDNCPAYITDKKLSPKHLTLALRDHLYASEGALFDDGVVTPTDGPTTRDIIPAGEAIHTNPPAPEGAYFLRNEAPIELVPNIIHPDVIWACTSCRACEEQCPVMITYVDKIIGMRREEVMIKNEFPPSLQGAFNGIETNGNPWNISSMDRAKWTDGLSIPFIKDHPTAEVLYWVGCAGSFDDRAKKVARSVAQLLTHAGVDFAILGTEETCTGDPARRAGNEYLFQMLAEQNIETLNGYKAQEKTIITACPHCFNTIGNEYSDFGGDYDVVHHTDFLYGLLASKKLIPTKKVEGTVVYHDSCYLGRYNQVYESPRKILTEIGLTVTEVPYWNKKQGLCCGAGGAQMFMEEHAAEGNVRVNEKRTLQVLGTGAKTVASACPFCMTMLSDGIKSDKVAEKSDRTDVEEVAQLDVAELLCQAVEFTQAQAAE